MASAPWVRIAAVAAVAALAGACGGSEKTTTVTDSQTGESASVTQSTEGDTTNVTIETSDGSSVTSQSGTDVKLPEGMPGWAPAYPGATVVSVMAGTSGDGSTGGMVTLETKDAVDKVASFYEQRIKQAGLKASATVATADSRMIGIENKDGQQGGMVTIAKSGEDATTVSIVYGTE
jgi:hypothetical protein